MDNDAGLALFSITGCVDINISLGAARPVQCSGGFRIADLLSIIREADSKLPDGARSDSNWHMFGWGNWEWCTNVFFLNSHLTPVLHGSRVIFAYSVGDEAEGPVVVGGRPERVAIRVPNLKLVFRDFSPRSLAGNEAPRWEPFGAPRKTCPSAKRTSPNASRPTTDCTNYPMVIHSTRVVSVPTPQDTRGMFAISTMDGQLPYTETVGSLPRQAVVDLSEEKHSTPEMALRVNKFAYDGENLLVLTYGMKFHLAFTPRRKGVEGCCPLKEKAGKPVQDQTKTRKKRGSTAAAKRRR